MTAAIHLVTSETEDTLATRMLESRLEAEMEAEWARAKTAPVRRAIREVEARARECLKGADVGEEFTLAAAAAALKGELVPEACGIYMQLRRYMAERPYDCLEWLELRLALARFLTLQQRVPGRPYPVSSED